jgi:hypothetical protein
LHLLEGRGMRMLDRLESWFEHETSMQD